jgi:hypothetical protein
MKDIASRASGGGAASRAACISAAEFHRQTSMNVPSSRRMRRASTRAGMVPDGGEHRGPPAQQLFEVPS